MSGGCSVGCGTPGSDVDIWTTRATTLNFLGTLTSFCLMSIHLYHLTGRFFDSCLNELVYRRAVLFSQAPQLNTAVLFVLFAALLNTHRCVETFVSAFIEEQTTSIAVCRNRSRFGCELWLALWDTTRGYVPYDFLLGVSVWAASVLFTVASWFLHIHAM